MGEDGEGMEGEEVDYGREKMLEVDYDREKMLEVNMGREKMLKVDMGSEAVENGPVAPLPGWGLSSLLIRPLSSLLALLNSSLAIMLPSSTMPGDEVSVGF